MGVLTTCPACGMKSDSTRCPRCNALKVVGCSGSCALCHERCESAACDSDAAEPLPTASEGSPTAGSDG